jgi:hypothetical protein
VFVIICGNDYCEQKCGITVFTWEKIMNLKLPDKYTTATILFMAAAAVLVAIALITDQGEFITAALVISGTICAMTGFFILTFSGGESVDLNLVGLLPAQGCINLCRIASDLGITGNAYFLPPHRTGEAWVRQFNPVSTYNGSKVSTKGSFPQTGPAGLVTIPSCDPLIQNLRKKNALVIPDKEEFLTHLLREIIEEVFEFSPRVSAIWHGSTVTITFHGYRLIDGCHVIAQASPHYCAMNPCSVCSLCGALIAEGTDKVVTLDQCSSASSSQDVTATFSILPLLDGDEQIKVPVARIDTITSGYIRFRDALFE